MAFNVVGGHLAPEATGRLAARLFLNRCTARREEEQAADGVIGSESHSLPSGRSGTLQGSGAPGSMMHDRSSGPEAPLALTSLVVRRGFTAVVIKAPGHDPVEPKPTTPVAFVRAIREAAQAIGQPDSIIGHSIAALSAMSAVADGLFPTRARPISSPSMFTGALDTFTHDSELHERAQRYLRSVVNQAAGRPEHELESESIRLRIRSPVVIICDQCDREMPFKENVTMASAIRSSVVVSRSDLGHPRLHSYAKVLKTGSDFRSRDAARLCNLPYRPASG